MGTAPDPHALGLSSRVPGGVPRGWPGVRELRGHVHAALEEGWHRALPVQRLWALPQNERHQPATQAAEEAGKRGKPRRDPLLHPGGGWRAGAVGLLRCLSCRGLCACVRACLTLSPPTNKMPSVLEGAPGCGAKPARVRMSGVKLGELPSGHGWWAARRWGSRDQRGPRAARRGCATAKEGLISPARSLGLVGFLRLRSHSVRVGFHSIIIIIIF